MKPAISVEFFPPNTPEGLVKLRETQQLLNAAIAPEYFSVTYGAGGVTREKTLAIVLDIAASGAKAVPHLSCIGSSSQSIREQLALYKAHGIQGVVALRGDLPSGMGDPGEFRYADELVRFVRAEMGSTFDIKVAAYPEYHPQAKSPDADLNHFVQKVRAGSSSAITQLFYNPDAYFAFVDAARAKGVTIPIIPGIMPIHNFSKILRFCESSGAELPRWVRLKMEKFYDDADSIRAFGIEVVAKLCQRLIDQGVPGLHFYCLNQSKLTVDIVKRLQGI